jgi:subtilisin
VIDPRNRAKRWLLVALILLGLAAPAGAGAHVIPGRYIVALRHSADTRSAARIARRDGADVTFLYRTALNGYAARMSPREREAISRQAQVVDVARDRRVKAAGEGSASAPFTLGSQVVPTGVRRIGGTQSSTRSGDGAGSVPVNVAVLDTGVDLDHPDLNVRGGHSCMPKSERYDDVNGHGTANAGLIGARDNDVGVVGVAPGAPLWSVRVLNAKGYGSNASILCGIDWVTSTRTDADPTNDIAVANASLSGPGADDTQCGAGGNLEHQAICRSTDAGVLWVAAAGNEARDLKRSTPATFGQVLTATALTDFDGRPGGRGEPDAECQNSIAGPFLPALHDDVAGFFSNFAVSREDHRHVLAASGVCIPSTARGGGYDLAFGTSAAAPLIAGTAALCIESGECASTPESSIRTLRGTAHRYAEGHPHRGFQGDPMHRIPGRYYGYLVRAGEF